MSWFIVDVYSDVKMQYRVAAETIEADASDEAQRRVAELYPRARTFRCMEIREAIARRLKPGEHRKFGKQFEEVLPHDHECGPKCPFCFPDPPRERGTPE